MRNAAMLAVSLLAATAPLAAQDVSIKLLLSRDVVGFCGQEPAGYASCVKQRM